MPSRGFVAAALLPVVALVAAGCGGGDGDGGGGSARGVTADEVKVAGLSSLSGPASWSGVDVGAEARIARANEEGGVAGRQIDYVGTRDDAGNPAQNLSLARKLVLNEKVFAILPATSVALQPTTTNFLEQQQVPFFGWGFTPGFCGTKMGFGFNGCLVGDERVNMSLAGPAVDGLELEEGSSVAVQSWDTSSGKSGGSQMQKGLETLGMEVPYMKTNLPATPTTDFTPYVQALLRSNGGQPPDAIIINAGGVNDTGLTGALRAAGYQEPIITYTSYLPDLLKGNAAFRKANDGSYVITQWLPAEFGGPAIEQIQKDLDLIGSDSAITSNVSMGYWSADVFIQALEAVGEDLSPERFNEVVNGGDFRYEPDQDPPGVGPLEFPGNHDYASPCAAMVQAKGTEFEPVLDLTCYDQVVKP
jgi:branched-chain amino acid transport system substrate-binding protein